MPKFDPCRHHRDCRVLHAREAYSLRLSLAYAARLVRIRVWANAALPAAVEPAAPTAAPVAVAEGKKMEIFSWWTRAAL